MSLYPELVEALGEERVVVDEAEKIVYSHDLAALPKASSLVFKMVPDYIVYPESIEDLSKILKIANRHRVPVIPRGAGTWGYGGSVPINGGIMVDLRGLDRIKEFDEGRGLLRVEGGAVWLRLMEFLKDTAWALPCYPSSAPSSTVGGWAATGGLGYGSLKHGPFKDNVEEVTIVLPNGDVRTVKKTDTGTLSFETLFGSEGILCIFAELSLKLVPREVEKPFVAYFAESGRALKAAKLLLEETTPFAMMLRTSAFLRAGAEQAEGGTVVYGCFTGSEDTVAREYEVFKKAVASQGGIVGSEEAAEHEWDERFYPLRIKRWGPTVVTADITVPVNRLEDAIMHFWRLGRKARADVDLEIVYVSKSEGLCLPIYLTDERRASYLVHLAIIKKLIDYALRVGGKSYGYGLWNSFFMGRSEPERLRLLKSAKKKLDPKDILNPGKTITARTKWGLPIPNPLYKAMLEGLWATGVVIS